MTKLRLNGQQTVNPQKIIKRPPAIMFSLATNLQGGIVRNQGANNNVR